MTRKFLIHLWILLISLSSCDEGRIYEDAVTTFSEGRDITVVATLVNVNSWPETYTICIAAFEEDSDFAVLSKSIGIPDSDSGQYEISLSNIPASASVLELCVINRLRQRIATFCQIDITNEATIELRIPEPIDVNLFDVIQDKVFSSTCANCHGASNFAAANLFLTQGKSYEYLVGKTSEVMGDTEKRVVSGSRNNSLLYKILTGDISSSWQYDHSSEITDYNTLELIGAWIDNGACN